MNDPFSAEKLEAWRRLIELDVQWMQWSGVLTTIGGMLLGSLLVVWQARKILIEQRKEAARIKKLQYGSWNEE